MRVFVGGLWAGVRAKDLDQLVRSLLRGPWYKLHMPRGRVADCELLCMTDRRNGQSEYCAVIEVEPRRLAWEVVQRLDGAKSNGRTLRAHRWFPRVGLVDRRAGATEAGQAGGDRRSGRDRRRNLDVQQLNRSLTQAVTGFERSYGS